MSTKTVSICLQWPNFFSFLIRLSSVGITHFSIICIGTKRKNKIKCESTAEEEEKKSKELHVDETKEVKRGDEKKKRDNELRSKKKSEF